MKKILITGGCGFIGSNFVKYYLKKYPNINILNLDNLTYAANKKLDKSYIKFKNYSFKKIDIGNFSQTRPIIKKFDPDLLINFAAESHVDNSIKYPDIFLKTNINGTMNLLKSISKKTLFYQISTDEVFGDIIKKPFDEKTCYNPRSPYSASKASADHLVRSWSNTYGYKYLIFNCCNNFGPRQHLEKFIPTIIKSLLKKKKVPIYGKGLQKREWIFVEDFIRAIDFIIKKKIKNQTFCVGSGVSYANKNLVNKIAKILKYKFNIKINNNYKKFIKDRPGHDFEYRVNSKKIRKIGWKTKYRFNEGLEKTVNYYIKNIKI